MDEPIKKVETLFNRWSTNRAESVIPLPESGSYRTYYRIKYDKGTVLGVHNADIRENEAFLYLSRQLGETGSKVPQVISADLENHVYLEEDLGDLTLFDHLALLRKRGCTEEEIKELYSQIIDSMPALQVHSNRGLDYSKCYPRAEFDVQSMMWDMNYFKYCLLKPLKISFFEQDLEDDFVKIVHWLIDADRSYFMFRDFQSRNIMLHNNSLYFIDFQGGRRGPLQYDLASLLFEAKTHLSHNIREEMLKYYIEVFTSTFKWFNKEDFLKYYYGFVYLRLMQAMGAYGFRGYIERKPVFLQSLPYAVQTLKWLMENQPLPLSLTALPAVFEKLINLPQVREYEIRHDALTVTIGSFSYKNGIPQDHSGNGGGFVFDCRCLENPGRYEEYKNLSGKDQAVIDFLQKNEDVHQFIAHAFALVLQTCDVYAKRGFNHLMVNFGCTGGQHRSVYMAEKLAAVIREKATADVIVIHHELGKKAAK